MPPPPPAPKPQLLDLLLIGGGHAHLHMLKMFGMKDSDGGFFDTVSSLGLRVTLISKDTLTPYSGMIPGYVAGHYDFDQAHIDLSRICGFSGVRLIKGEVNRIDYDKTKNGGRGGGVVYLQEDNLLSGSVGSGCLRGRGGIRYDILCIDVGSSPNLGNLTLIESNNNKDEGEGEGEGKGDVQKVITAVKPISTFSSRWDELLQIFQDKCAFQKNHSKENPHVVVVVGSGAGGVELCLSLHYRLSNELRDIGVDASHFKVVLVARSGKLLSQHNDSVRVIFERILAERGIEVLRNVTPVSVQQLDRVKKQMNFDDDTSFEFSTSLFCTSACAPSFFKTSTPFPLTPESEGGFLCIDSTFQVVNTPGVFASGDCATNVASPRPKAGVFAVRAGVMVRENVLRYAQGLRLTEFELQMEFLGLISTGDKNAVASRGTQALEGEILWKLKDAIDVTWMEGFQVLPVMEVDKSLLPSCETGSLYNVKEKALIENLMRCGGCGAKVGAGVLERVLRTLSRESEEDKSQSPSLRDMDDCAVIRLSPHPKTKKPPTHLLQTIDYTPSFFSDPYQFGYVAAIHAMSDVFAMCIEDVEDCECRDGDGSDEELRGGRNESNVNLNLLCLASTPPTPREAIIEDTLTSIMRGSFDAVESNGGRIVGGHTVEGPLGLGFAVSAAVYDGEDGFLTKGGGQIGDKIIMTKRLGIGALFAAEMRGLGGAREREEAIESMMASNRIGGQIAAKMNRKGDGRVVRSCTDITGFGLIGHLIEMVKATSGTVAARNSSATVCCAAQINLRRVNFLHGGLEAAQKDIFSTLQPENYKQRGGVINHEEIVNDGNPNLVAKYKLLYNPETSGGLLFFVSPHFAQEFTAELSAAKISNCEIGELVGVERRGEYCDVEEDGERIRKGGNYIKIKN